MQRDTSPVLLAGCGRPLRMPQTHIPSFGLSDACISSCVTSAWRCRSGGAGAELVTNFESEQPSSHFAELYRRDSLQGGHVIMLGADPDSKCGSAERV